jgi:hypothetical protein
MTDAQGQLIMWAWLISNWYWFMIGFGVLAVAVLTISPAILSSRISEAERQRGGRG